MLSVIESKGRFAVVECEKVTVICTVDSRAEAEAVLVRMGGQVPGPTKAPKGPPGRKPITDSPKSPSGPPRASEGKIPPKPDLDVSALRKRLGTKRKAKRKK